MKRNCKRVLALIMTLCLLAALMPTALAALPTATAYIQDTDGVDSGAVYAIYTNESDSGSQNRILYHTGTGKTDKVTGSVSGNELALNGGFAASRQLWTITAVEGGYTVQSVDSGYYLDLSQASTSNLNTSAEAVVLTIDFDEETGLYTMAFGDSYLSFNPSGNTSFLTDSTGYGLRFYKQTEVVATPVEREDLIPQPGTTQDEPFAPGTGGSSNFRIPSIITLDSGRILAAIDARWNHLGDACALDTIVSYSDDGGKTWNYSFANYFGDSVDAKQTYATAFIDPVMVQGNDGTIYLMVDLFPGGVALNTAPMAPAKSSGYVEIDGVQRLVLYTSGNVSEQSDSNYVSYVGDFVDGYARIYNVDGSATDYYVDDHYYLYQGNGSDPDAQEIYCQQLGSSNYIQQNVFFYNADLHVRCATYLWLVTSTDGGKTWSAPTILNPQIRTGEDQFYGVGPGAGLCLEDGTIMLPAYTFTSGMSNSNQIASFIYSTDGGETWHRSDNATGSDHWSSESCLVQIDETTVRHFYRDGYSTLYYTDHTWNGEKWVAGDPVDTGVTNTSNNQLSAIKYSQQLDGKDAILVSTATGAGGSRTNGKIYTFVVNEDKTLELVNTYEVTASGVAYGYSSLTELTDGSVAVLYEGTSSRSVFTVISAADLGFQEESTTTSVSVSLNQSVVDLEAGETATLTATYSPEDAKVTWTSSNETVATVTDGVITAVAPGTAVITVSVTSGGITRTASADVTVQGGDSVVLPDRYTDQVEETHHEAATTYELDTDGIDSGAVYAIFHAGSNRTLYHVSGTTNTDQVTGSASDGLLKLDSSFDATCQTWTITGDAESGYTIQSCDDGNYLNLNTVTTVEIRVPVTSESQSLTITPVEGAAGSYTVSRVVNDQTLYLAHQNATTQHYVSTEPTSFQFYLQVNTEEGYTYTTSVSGLEALLADLSALSSGDYTSDSWAALQSALTAAQAAAAAGSQSFDSPEEAQAAQDVIVQAAADLYSAKLDLTAYTGGSGTVILPSDTPSSGTGTGSGTGTDADDSTDDGGTVIDEPDTPLAELPFLDVSADAWYAEAVAYVSENGLMVGTSDTAFSPNATTTRGMIMTVLARMSGVDTQDSDPWYQAGMDWAVAQGISDGTQPGQDITREQLVTMLYRYAQMLGLDVTYDTTAADGFSDSGAISDYALEAMAWAVDVGLVTGVGNNTLAPQGTATRAQVATMLMRFAQIIE